MGKSRTVVLALLQTIMCALSLGLPALGLSNAPIPISFSLTYLAELARLSRAFTLPGTEGGGVAGVPTISDLYVGGEVALAFTCIGLIAAIVAGVLPFLNIEDKKCYSSSVTWFLVSGICAVAPLGFIIGINTVFGGSIGTGSVAITYGEATYTSAAAIALGLLSAGIEKKFGADDAPYITQSVFPKAEEVV